MVALSLWEANRCPLCGGNREECWAPENFERFEVPPPTRCHRTTALQRERRSYADQPDSAALMFRAQLRG